MKISVAVTKHLLKNRNIDHLHSGNSIVIKAEDKKTVMELVKEVSERNKDNVLVVDNYLLEELVIITFK
jgi:hypothetical protein